MENLNVALFRHLLSCAIRQTTVTYEEAAAVGGYPTTGSAMGQQLGRALDALNIYCMKQDLPLLSALVVRKSGADRGMPGRGFWTFLFHLGIEVPDDEKREVHANLAEHCFSVKSKVIGGLFELSPEFRDQEG